MFANIMIIVNLFLLLLLSQIFLKYKRVEYALEDEKDRSADLEGQLNEYIAETLAGQPP